MLKLFGRTKFVSWKQTHSDASDQTILVQTQLPMYRATAPYFSSVIRCFSTDTRPAPWPYSEFTWATSRPWTRPVSKHWGPTHSTQSTASICWFMAWSIEGLFGSSDTTWKWSDPGLWASHPKHIVYEIKSPKMLSKWTRHLQMVRFSNKPRPEGTAFESSSCFRPPKNKPSPSHIVNSNGESAVHQPSTR